MDESASAARTPSSARISGRRLLNPAGAEGVVDVSPVERGARLCGRRSCAAGLDRGVAEVAEGDPVVLGVPQRKHAVDSGMLFAPHFEQNQRAADKRNPRVASPLYRRS